MAENSEQQGAVHIVLDTALTFNRDGTRGEWRQWNLRPLEALVRGSVEETASDDNPPAPRSIPGNREFWPVTFKDVLAAGPWHYHKTDTHAFLDLPRSVGNDEHPGSELQSCSMVMAVMQGTVLSAITHTYSNVLEGWYEVEVSSPLSHI